MIDIPSQDPRPRWLIGKQAEGTGFNLLTVDGAPYPYTVTRSGLITPQFPYAVGYSGVAALYISEDVPPDDRGPILAHEVRENIRFSHLPEAERCTSALAAELREIQLSRFPLEYKQYVDRRTGFFNAQLRYYQAPQHAAGVTSGFLEGLLTAANYINFIDSGLKKKR